MKRFSVLSLLSLILILAVATACANKCEPNPEAGEYCEATSTGL